MKKINLKTPQEIELMLQGGKKLKKVKEELRKNVKIGVSAKEIDDLAEKLILSEGAEISFKKVPGYRWSTCVNVNEGVVHGIPHPSIIFKKGDVVSVDVGLFYKGFHTDTSFTVALDPTQQVSKFLLAGQEALKKAIDVVRPDIRVYEISKAIETVLNKHKYSPIEVLVGHGIGRNLHEEPQVPCFTKGRPEDTPILPVGVVIAIEVMYAMGSPQVYIDKADKWTILTKDGKIASLFEETVAVTVDGPLVLTR